MAHNLEVTGDWGDETPRFCIANLTEFEVKLLREGFAAGVKAHRWVHLALTGTDMTHAIGIDSVLESLLYPVEQIGDRLRSALVEGEDP